MEHLNVLLRFFFVSGVFLNFDVDFWPLLKAEKVLAPKQFWPKKFLQNFIFFLPFESINFQPAGLLKIALIVTPLLKGHPFAYWNLTNKQNYTIQSNIITLKTLKKTLSTF